MHATATPSFQTLEQIQGAEQFKDFRAKHELVAKKGYGPALVAGDSDGDGDAWMLKDFADTQIGVIVNRSKFAAAAIGKSGARFILQGRNENTGIFMPDEKTLKLGKTEAKLLA